MAIYHCYGDHLWGRYGFGNAYNLDKNWFDREVIGIDLGMALLAIENHRTGLPWRLMQSHPATRRAYEIAGIRPTTEKAPRVLNPTLISPQSSQPQAVAPTIH